MKNFRKIALWIFVALMSLGQLQRFELVQLHSGVVIYLHDIFIIFFIFHVLFTDYFLIKKFIINQINTHRKIKFFIGIMAISLIINSIAGDYISFLYFLRLLAYIIFGVSLAVLIQNNKYDPEYLKFQLFSVGIISLFLGFLQYIFITDTRFLSIFGWDDHYGRLISTYFDPGFTGIIFLLTLLIGLSCKYFQNSKIRAITTLLFVWGIILTFSRASYLALIASIVVLSISYLKITLATIKKIAFSFLIIFFLVLIAPKPFGEGVDLLRTSTITARIVAITQQLTSVSPQTLLIGNGLFSEKNSLNYKLQTKNNLIPSHSRIPDNICITIFLSTGLFGLLLSIALIFDWAKKIKSRNIYLFAGYVALIIHSQFNNSVLQPFVLLILLGGIATITRITRKPSHSTN